ncbi:MAG TPA: GMC family oxidoreductase [Rhodocyclaceae bacterium]|nr:GMC family oxidoreductase [Rhodocyclaceae bacterium]
MSQRPNPPQRPFPDLIGQAFDSTWRGQHFDLSDQNHPTTFEVDVAIIGSGAGGGTVARLLAEAGLKTLVIEEGPLYTARDFQLDERQAYGELYQEAAGRKTRDKAISILQGRAVGGSTLVNWTSSFRTPRPTLDHWQKEWGWDFATPEAMEPWFKAAEQRHSVAAWPFPPNANNDALALGLTRTGRQAHGVPRNVRGCWNLGTCGLGCPTNAKQSTLVACLPQALDRGGILLSRARVERLVRQGDRINEVRLRPMDRKGQPIATAEEVTVRARGVVLAAGAIGSPAVLLRSDLPDPHKRVGMRTFLHPVVLSGAIFDRPIEGFYGAPQTIYSDDFVWPKDGSAGFKLEVPPTHPLISSIVMAGHGKAHRQHMAQLDRLHIQIALLRDGFHPESSGGQVRLDKHGYPEVDYPISDYLWQGMRRALHVMAELQFAAGAKEVRPVHTDAHSARTLDEAKKMIDALPMRALHTRVVSAHVMGGCALSPDPQRGVARLDGRHHHLENLWIADGSIFPTSIGANPQLSIYSFAGRIAAGVATALGGTTIPTS